MNRKLRLGMIGGGPGAFIGEVHDPSRAYDNYQQMLEAELKREDKIDFVAVCTPNNWHFPIARDFLKAHIHVMCEKPMTMTLKEGKEMKKIVEKSGKVFGLMHTNTGYPMVKFARDMV